MGVRGESEMKIEEPHCLNEQENLVQPAAKQVGIAPSTCRGGLNILIKCTEFVGVEKE